MPSQHGRAEQRRGDHEPAKHRDEACAKARLLGREAVRVAVPVSQQGDDRGQVRDAGQGHGTETEQSAPPRCFGEQTSRAQRGDATEAEEQRGPQRGGRPGIDAEEKSRKQRLEQQEAAAEQRKHRRRATPEGAGRCCVYR